VAEESKSMGQTPVKKDMNASYEHVSKVEYYKSPARIKAQAAEKEEEQMMRLEMDNLMQSNINLQDALTAAKKANEACRTREGETAAELEQVIREYNHSKYQYAELLNKYERNEKYFNEKEGQWNTDKFALMKRIEELENQNETLQVKISIPNREPTVAVDTSKVAEEIGALLKANTLLRESLEAQAALNKAAEEKLRDAKQRNAEDAGTIGSMGSHVDSLKVEIGILKKNLSAASAKAEEDAAKALQRAEEQLLKAVDAKEKSMMERQKDYTSKIKMLEEQVERLSKALSQAETEKNDAVQRLENERRMNQLMWADQEALIAAEKAEWITRFEEQIKSLRQQHDQITTKLTEQIAQLTKDLESKMSEIARLNSIRVPCVNTEPEDGEEQVVITNHSISTSMYLTDIELKNIKNVEFIGDNDPFVMLSIGELWKFKTDTRWEAGSNMTFEFTKDSPGTKLELSREDLRKETLTVQVFDANRFRADVCIGTGQASLYSIGTAKKISVKVELPNNCGTIIVHFMVEENLFAYELKQTTGPIFTEHLKRIRERMISLENKIEKLKKAEKEWDQQKSYLQKRYDDERIKAEELQKKMLEKDGILIKLQGEKDRLSSRLSDKVEEETHHLNAITSLRKEVEALRSGNSNLQAEVTKLRAKIDILEKSARIDARKIGILEEQWEVERNRLAKNRPKQKTEPDLDAIVSVQLSSVSVSELKCVETFGGKNDPYCVLSIGEEWKLTTAAISEAGHSADWHYLPDSEGATFQISRRELRTQTLAVTCSDKNEILKDKLIGEGAASTAALSECDGTITFDLELRHIKDKGINGKMKIKFVVIGPSEPEVGVVHPEHVEDEIYPEEVEDTSAGREEDENADRVEEPKKNTSESSPKKNTSENVTEHFDQNMFTKEIEPLRIANKNLESLIRQLHDQITLLSAEKTVNEKKLSELKKSLNALRDSKADYIAASSDDDIFSLTWTGDEMVEKLRSTFGRVANKLDQARETLEMKAKGASAIPETLFWNIIEKLEQEQGASSKVPFQVQVRCYWDPSIWKVICAVRDPILIMPNNRVRSADRRFRDPSSSVHREHIDTSGMMMNWFIGGSGFLFGKAERFKVLPSDVIQIDKERVSLPEKKKPVSRKK
jgi:hypothetical protein